MQHPEYLYHYTTLDFVPKILEDGFLMLTPSNLVKPSDTGRSAARTAITTS